MRRRGLRDCKCFFYHKGHKGTRRKAMTASYELWLLDDKGKRILLLQNMAFFSYSRPVKGIGTLLIGIPYREFREQIFPVFEPDWRVDVWRSPQTGMPLRREGTYLLRTHKIYTRKLDGMDIISFYGRDLKDLLRRRYVIQAAGFPQTRKENYIDDMMKEIVTEQMLYGSALDETGAVDNGRAWPENEFLVQGDTSIGPSFTATFADQQVLDILRELQDASFQLNENEPLVNVRIYFDIVAFDAAPGAAFEQGFKFVTFGELRGEDRSESALIFSVQNNNLEMPYYTLDHSDEENSIVVKGFGRGNSRATVIVDDPDRISASRWNRCEGYEDASTEPDQDFLEDFGYTRLYEGAPREELSAVFLNVPGSEDTPRSLYGVDWDLGDLLPVDYAGNQVSVEVVIVYVGVDQDGAETITGRNDINAGDQ